VNISRLRPSTSPHHGSTLPSKAAALDPSQARRGEDEGGKDDSVALSDEVQSSMQPKPSRDLAESQTVGAAGESQRTSAVGSQPSRSSDDKMAKKVTKFSPGSTRGARPKTTPTTPKAPEPGIVSGQEPGSLGGPPMRTVKQAKPNTESVMSERRPTNRMTRNQYLSNLQSTFGE
jgi:hypothetical protein